MLSIKAIFFIRIRFICFSPDVELCGYVPRIFRDICFGRTIKMRYYRIIS